MSSKNRSGHSAAPKRRRGGGHEEHEEHENHERWLLTYADMITLLMVLFIVMFAISQVDQAKFMALRSGLAGGFGSPVTFMAGGTAMLEPGGSVAPDSVNLGSVQGQRNGNRPLDYDRSIDTQKVAELADATAKAQTADELSKLKAARAQLQAALNKAGIPKGATFRFNERGLVVTIASDEVLFDSGQATLRPDGKRILDALGPTLRRVTNRLSIDGHTNSIPINTARFPSNWELSTDRATGVLRYLMSRWDIRPTKMSASGFADTQPLIPGDSARARVVNRRVEIVVLAALDNPAGRALAQQGAAADAAEAAAAKAAAARAKAAEASAQAAQHAADDAAAKARDAAIEAAAKSKAAADARAAASARSARTAAPPSTSP